MSNLDRTPSLSYCGGRSGTPAEPVHQLFTGREVLLGESNKVRRLLPNLGRRLVGAWCFVDHYGPDDVARGDGMQVPPHPHMGLQTVSWLLDGEVHHRDSIGSDVVIRPGELGLMTSGRAIAHAEQSPVPRPEMLHGVQLWVALTQTSRGIEPGWEHHAALPRWTDGGLTATVMMGTLGDATSPGRAFSPLVGADLDVRPGGGATLPLEPDFEHAVLVMSGWAEVDGEQLAPGVMLYLGTGRRDLSITSEPGARLMLLGGEPFGEQIVMWWNFVARSHEEIVQAREDWMSGDRFGTVSGGGDRLPAPPAPTGRLKPGGPTR